MKSLRSIIFGALVGNIMEFYDFIIYAYFSNQIAKQFFSSKDPFVSTLLTFMVFASGYLTRPIGAIFFGNLGDKYGRKKALINSIALITGSTAMIGMLPTFNEIGILAPMLLVLCRLLQGFAVSGEQSGAAVYLAENSRSKIHGLIGGLVLGSSYFGVLLGSLTCLLITICSPYLGLEDNAWRVPFLLSIPLGIISLKLRLAAADSSEFNLMKEKNLIRKSPVGDMFKLYPALLFKMIVLTASLAVPIYLYVVYLPNYLITIAGYSQKESLFLSSCSILFISLLVPIIGLTSDRVGHDKTLKLGYFASILLAYPSFLFLQTNTYIGLM